MSTFVLKIIAIILMVIDHTGLYFRQAPTWFRYLGRGSFPIFLFCMVWGYHYTKNRKIYLLRLYLMSVFMTFFLYAVNYYLPTTHGTGNHNIFISMFMVGVLISTIELFLKHRKKGALALIIIFFVQILFIVVPQGVPWLKNMSGDFIVGLIPSLVASEYGWEFIVLGVLMYFLKEKKDAFTVMYILFCIAQFSSEMRDYSNAIQCFMIIALPFMLRYNNQKGPSMKYFFYLFYPAHAFLLFYLANFVFV